MDALFAWLSDAMTGAPWLAVVAAAGWGMASLVLSPCHLASIPLVVGFVAQRDEALPRQALGVALLFALGILVSIAAVGGATAAAGRMLGDLGLWTGYLVAAVLVGVGLHLLGWLKLPWERTLALPRYQGPAAAFLLGLVFGLALGPCTFAYLAPVLGLVFGVARTQPLFAALLVFAYGIGHCVLIVAAGVFTEKVQRVLDWHGASRGAGWLRRASGMMVLVGAAWLIYST